MVKTLDMRLAAVQLIDAHYCTDANKFISAALLGTTTLLRLELPTVNVLSKVDLLSRYGELPLGVDFFTDCNDLDRLLPFLDNIQLSESTDPFSEEFDYVEDPDYLKARRKRQQSKLSQKHAKLHKALAEIVDDFGLLSFLPLDISSAESVGRVLAKIDKCNGYVFAEATINEDLFQCAAKSDSNYEAIADVRERVASPESIKELSTDTAQ
jgi:GPN-loop GTPase